MCGRINITDCELWVLLRWDLALETIVILTLDLDAPLDSIPEFVSMN